jgi:hypothetical protein
MDKKRRTVREGLGKQGAFFIDLLRGKQVLKTHKTPLVRWGALDWVGENTSAIEYRFFLYEISEMKQTNN